MKFEHASLTKIDFNPQEKMILNLSQFGIVYFSVTYLSKVETKSNKNNLFKRKLKIKLIYLHFE